MFAASKGNGLCCSFPAYAKPVGQGFLVYSSVQLVTVKLPEYQNFEAGISCKISSLYNYLKWLMIILTKKKKTNKQAKKQYLQYTNKGGFKDCNINQTMTICS